MEKQKIIFKDKDGYFIEQDGNRIDVKPVDSNPFNPNPFVTKTVDMNNYAKNRPVKGGYFAGYYNGKPNIVGQRLFVEV